MKGIRWAVVIILANFLFSQAFGGGEDFSISSLSKKEKRVKRDRYLLLTAVYRSRPKKASDVKVKFYTLLKKGSKEILAEGSQSFLEVEKGKHEVIMVITDSHLKSYGSVKKIRVEIWYDEKLVASETKPSLGKKKKWWEKREAKNIIEPGEEIMKLIERIKDLE